MIREVALLLVTLAVPSTSSHIRSFGILTLTPEETGIIYIQLSLRHPLSFHMLENLLSDAAAVSNNRLPADDGQYMTDEIRYASFQIWHCAMYRIHCA